MFTFVLLMRYSHYFSFLRVELDLPTTVIIANFADGSKIQVTFPQVRVQVTTIEINEQH